MTINTHISWCNSTVNLWHGCVEMPFNGKIHPGCVHCYAKNQSKRYGKDIWGSDKPRWEIKGAWRMLRDIQKIAKKTGEKQTVFVGSMMDIFEKPMPLIDSKSNLITGLTTGDLRDQFFEIIPDYPELIFLLLTKRIMNVWKYIPESWHNGFPNNVMIGYSVSDQETWNGGLPYLTQLGYYGKTFISAEPLTGEIILDTDPEKYLPYWLIIGAESQPGCRPMQDRDAISLISQCEHLEIPAWFKQRGGFLDKRDRFEEWPMELQVQQTPSFFQEE